MSELNHQDPSGIAKIEQELAKVMLPETTVDRDELMYRSGYEAALAVAGQQVIPAPVSESFPGRKKSNVAFWKSATLVSASVAALLAILLMTQLPSGGPGTQVVKSTGAEVSPSEVSGAVVNRQLSMEEDADRRQATLFDSYTDRRSGSLMGLLQFPVQSVSLQDLSNLSIRQKLVRIEHSSMKYESPVDSESVERDTPLSSFGSLQRLQGELF